jgi:hypothetical protein
MDYCFVDWMPTLSIDYKWLLHLRRSLDKLHFNEVQQSEPFLQEMIDATRDTDFTTIGLHANTKTALLAFLYECHDGTHRAGELLTANAKMSDCL